MSKAKKYGNSFIVQGGILAIAGIIVRIIGLARRIPLTNIIGDEGNGFYAAAYEIYSIVLLLSSYSLPLAVSKMVSSRVSKGQYKNANKIFKGALFFAFIVGATVAILVFIFADFLAGSMLEPMSAMALRILSPALFIVAIMGVFRGYFQGLGTMMPTAVSQIIEQIFLVFASITGAIILSEYGDKVAALLHNPSYKTAYGAAGGTIGCGIGALVGLAFLVFLYFVYKPTFSNQIAKDTTKTEESYRLIYKIIIITIIPVILSTAVYNISNILDQRMFNGVMISKGLGDIKTDQWGIFSGKYRVLTNIPIALASAMSSSVIPTLAGAFVNNGTSQIRQKIQSVIRFTMIISIPCVVGMSVLGKPIVSLLFSGDINIASNMLQFGSISIVLYSLSTLTNGILQGINRMKVPVTNAIISLGIHLISLYLLLKFTNLGIYAVVIANILFATIMCILNGLAIKKYMHYKQEVVKTFIIPSISAILMGIIIVLLYNVIYLFTGNLLSTSISIVVGTICYFVFMIMFRGLGESEINRLPGGQKLVSILKKAGILKKEAFKDET